MTNVDDNLLDLLERAKKLVEEAIEKGLDPREIPVFAVHGPSANAYEVSNCFLEERGTKTSYPDVEILMDDYEIKSKHYVRFYIGN